jgi:hypothetical protein
MRIRPLSRFSVLLLPLPVLWLTCCKAGDDAGPENPIQGLDFSMVSQVLAGEFNGAGLALMLPSGPPGCLSATSWDDGDADGVLDDSDFTFSASGCRFTFDDGWGTTSGAIHILDPGNDFGFSATLNGLAYTISVDANGGDPAETRVRTLHGERSVSGSPSQVTLMQDVDLTYTVTSRPSAQVSETWQAVFTASQGSAVAFGVGARLPDGSTVITGPMSWTQSGATVSLSLETTVPIWFDPGCQSPFPSAGEVHAHVVSGGPNGYVRVRWSSCGGESEVDFVGA